MQKLLTNKRSVVFFLFLFLSVNSFSQDLLNDLQFIQKEKINTIKTPPKHTRSYIYKNEKTIKKYNPVNMTFGGLLFLYQNVLSQQFSANCLYNPSCSEFSKQSIHQYGLLKGLLLSSDRVMRCNRIAATGIHPIRVENNKVQDPVSFYQLKK